MLFGHEDKVEFFKNLAKWGKLGHAYFLFGDSGVGKRTLAEMFAGFLEVGLFELSPGPLLDVTIFSPNEKGTLSIDVMRDVKKFLFQKPFRSLRRTVIIDEAEKLTGEAASALLKIVEEPPVHSLIFFIARQEESLFPPLLSRLTKVYFSRLSRSTLFNILVSDYNVPHDKARDISKMSFGRIGRAIELLNPTGKNKEDETFEDQLEEKILGLWGGDVYKNSRALSWLLNRELLVNRYNLNPNIQSRAVRYIISGNKSPHFPVWH